MLPILSRWVFVCCNLNTNKQIQSQHRYSSSYWGQLCYSAPSNLFFTSSCPYHLSFSFSSTKVYPNPALYDLQQPEYITIFPPPFSQNVECRYAKVQTFSIYGALKIWQSPLVFSALTPHLLFFSTPRTSLSFCSYACVGVCVFECVWSQQVTGIDKRGHWRAENGQGATDAPGRMKPQGKPTKQTCQQTQ